MKKPYTYYGKNTAGSTRIDGVTIITVTWWAKNHMTDLAAIADTCDFSAIYTKRDDIIGHVILKNHDFLEEMMEDFRADPFHKYMLDTMGLAENGANVIRVQTAMSDILARCIGQILIDTGWWSANEKRIMKDRKNYRSVCKVMQS